MANQTYNQSASELAVLAAVSTPPVVPLPVTQAAGTETLFLNLKNNKSVPVLNVKSYAIDPPAFSIWNTNVTYVIGNIVQGSDGNLYTSLTNANQGNNPTTSATNWATLPMQRFCDGTVYRNENVGPTGQGLQIIPTGQFASGTTVVAPGGEPTTVGTNGFVMLNDEQAAIAPRPQYQIRARYIFTRQAQDGSAMVQHEVFCDLVQSISDGPFQ